MEIMKYLKSYNESILKLHDNYPYNCVVVKMNNVDEFNDFLNIMSKYNVVYRGKLDKRLAEQLLNEVCYVRIYFDSGMGLCAGGNRLSDIKKYDTIERYTYEKVFSMNEFRKGILDDILNRGGITPTYRPKKITRTLESINESIKFLHKNYPYTTVIFKVDSSIELREMAELLKSYISNEEYRFLIERSMELFSRNISQGYVRVAIDDDDKLYVGCAKMDRLKEVLDEKEQTYEKIYTIEDLKSGLLTRILTFGIMPTYKPRKIDRTLESVKEPEYRFKTEQEMIKEFGEGWRHKLNWNYEGKMDYLLGKPFYDKYLKTSDMKIDNRWTVYSNSLTKNIKQVPSYKPKKIDRRLD